MKSPMYSYHSTIWIKIFPIKILMINLLHTLHDTNCLEAKQKKIHMQYMQLCFYSHLVVPGNVKRVELSFFKENGCVLCHCV